jgi:predicted RecB family nuclease
MSNPVTDSHRPHLSKSRIVAGWKSPRYLWWKVNRPEAPEMQPSVADLDWMEQGGQVGVLATTRFPGGVLIDLPYDQMAGKVEATRQALDAGAPAIFEASFWEDEVFVAVDVLERQDDTFRLIEVKATTRVKDAHIPDAAIQLYVLRKAGLDVREVVLMHLNPEYRHAGPEDLFTLSDIMAEAEAFLPEIPALIEACHDVLAGPDPGPCRGDQCGRGDWTCPLDALCWPQDPDHIRRLAGVGTKTALRYMARGVHTFDDLPPDARLSDKARRQLEVWRSGEMRVESTLAEDLEPFRCRLGFLDFETISRAVPPWDGLSPYGIVPIQFSYHERQPDSSYTHADWLAEGAGDPRPEIARALVEAARHADRVVTYTNYEKRCIGALRSAVPELDAELSDLESRLLDLKKVVERNLAHPDFMGSYSIKDVLTPLVPDLSYQGLEVADGMTASVELARMMLEADSMTDEDRLAKRAALLEYCKLDTWAMVRLLERLEELAS